MTETVFVKILAQVLPTKMQGELFMDNTRSTGSVEREDTSTYMIKLFKIKTVSINSFFLVNLYYLYYSCCKTNVGYIVPEGIVHKLLNGGLLSHLNQEHVSLTENRPYSNLTVEKQRKFQI